MVPACSVLLCAGGSYSPLVAFFYMILSLEKVDSFFRTSDEL